MRIVVAYAAVAAALLILDFAYIGTIGAALFKRTLGDSMAPDVAKLSAVLFYLLYVVGILYFATLPALEDGAWTTALLRGALFGFFAYLTYDMTNLATLKNYTVSLAVTDLAWGTFVTAASAAIGYAVTARFG